jgi:sugar phosphate isomerase/epimerase
MLEMLKRIDSEYVGVCIDTGNSFSLLEDPIETA